MNVRYYQTVAGARPVERYLEELDPHERALITAVLEDIVLHGLESALVAMRPIEGKLWELKVARHRLFYVVVRGPEIVLLHAYKKQGQKAPRREIDLAKARMKEVLRGY